MIKIENIEVVGWEHAIRGMRNPKNSWSLSDSQYCTDSCDDCDNFSSCNTNSEPYFKRFWEEDPANTNYAIGPKDHKLMMSLAKGGPVHAKYRRMITVYMDITAPLYWWKEADKYQVGTVTNSCSTMHKIHDKEFTLDDFSCEHLMNEWKEEELVCFDGEYSYAAKEILQDVIIPTLNQFRHKYLEAKTKPMKEESKRAELMKKFWWQMIQLLPSSYNQKRTVMLNYEVLHNMYFSRKNHKLDEWREFCKFIESLPYSELITCKETANEEQ